MALTVRAQTDPPKPITMVVLSAPGGAVDVVARKLGLAVSESLDQTVIIENRAGVKGETVLYKGNARAMTDLIGGQLSAMMAPSLSALTARLREHAADGGRLRCLPGDQEQRYD